jgi:hypothetical protein
MVATAERIDFINHSIDFQQGSPGPRPFPSRSTLIVDFRVFRRGPAHVCGLIYTVNFWAQSKVAFAVFEGFQGDDELWRATVTESGPDDVRGASFEYVLFCDDHRGNNEVKKVYNTNKGETFRIQ